MTLEEAVGYAVLIVVLAAVAVNGLLYRPLGRVLAQHSMNPVLARFWAAFARVMILLVPVIVLLFTFANGSLPSHPDWIWVVNLAKWGLLGLFGVLAGVAGVVLSCGRGRHVPVWVEPDQADDLNRLLDRVREVRAREIVRRADAEY